MTEREEKISIQNRLREYRKTHGAGCFLKVSKAINARSRISDDALFRVMIGAVPPMKIGVWRKIAKALDLVEAKERLIQAEVLGARNIK